MYLLNKYYTIPVVFTLLGVLFINAVAMAQTVNPGAIDALPSAKKAKLMREIDLGELLMEEGDFKGADEKFRLALANLETVPSRLVFLVGKNSLFLENYKQSIDWLNKYIELKGTTGQYYSESVSMKKEAEKKYLHINSTTNPTDSATSIPSDSTTNNNGYDCEGKEKFICPVCKGKTVIIEDGRLGQVYKDCPYSDKHGYLTCEEYYQLLEGRLKPKF